MKAIIRTLTMVAAAVLVAVPSAAFSDAPTMMNYQGRLTDPMDNPINGTYTIQFAVYDDSLAGNQVWTETHSQVTVSNGLFTVLLGSESSPIDADVFSAADRWLGIKVEEDPEMVPRSRLVTTPYAFRPATIDGASGGAISGDVQIQSDLDVADWLLAGRASIGGHPDPNPSVPFTLYQGGGSNSQLVIVQNNAGKGAGITLLNNQASHGYHIQQAYDGLGHKFTIGSTNDPWTKYFTIDTTGNVGIGKTDPAFKLHVDGKIRSNESFVFPDGTEQTTAADTTGFDARYVNDGEGEVDGDDIAIGTELSGSTYGSGAVFSVTNEYDGMDDTEGLYGRSTNTPDLGIEGRSYGVKGIIGDGSGYSTLMTYAGVFGGAQTGYSDCHGVAGYSWDGYGIVGGSHNGKAGYFSGDIHVTGDITAGGSKVGWVADICYNDGTADLEVGDVVVLSGSATNRMMYGTIPIPTVMRCDEASDSKVLGVVIRRKSIVDAKIEELAYADASDAPTGKLNDGSGDLLSAAKADKGFDASVIPPGTGCSVAILGAIEKCKVDASYGEIEVGDLLTTSPTAGHAMKADQPQVGTIIGKALEPWYDGAGVIKISVTLK